MLCSFFDPMIHASNVDGNLYSFEVLHVGWMLLKSECTRWLTYSGRFCDWNGLATSKLNALWIVACMYILFTNSQVLEKISAVLCCVLGEVVQKLRGDGFWLQIASKRNLWLQTLICMILTKDQSVHIDLLLAFTCNWKKRNEYAIFIFQLYPVLLSGHTPSLGLFVSKEWN